MYLIQKKLGWTALFFAASGGHKEITEMLLYDGADVLIFDKSGGIVLDTLKEGSCVFMCISEATLVCSLRSIQ